MGQLFPPFRNQGNGCGEPETVRRTMIGVLVIRVSASRCSNSRSRACFWLSSSTTSRFSPSPSRSSDSVLAASSSAEEETRALDGRTDWHLRRHRERCAHADRSRSRSLCSRIAATHQAKLYKLTAIYLVSALPFFLTGLFFSVLFARRSSQISNLYAADLVGGAVACIGIVPCSTFSADRTPYSSPALPWLPAHCSGQERRSRALSRRWVPGGVCRAYGREFCAGR